MGKIAILIFTLVMSPLAQAFTDSQGMTCLNVDADISRERVYIDMIVGLSKSESDKMFEGIKKFGNNTCLSAALEAAGETENENGVTRSVFLKISPRSVCSDKDQLSAIIKTAQDAMTMGFLVFCASESSTPAINPAPKKTEEVKKIVIEAEEPAQKSEETSFEVPAAAQEEVKLLPAENLEEPHSLTL